MSWLKICFLKIEIYRQETDLFCKSETEMFRKTEGLKQFYLKYFHLNSFFNQRLNFFAKVKVWADLFLKYLNWNVFAK